MEPESIPTTLTETQIRRFFSKKGNYLQIQVPTKKTFQTNSRIVYIKCKPKVMQNF